MSAKKPFAKKHIKGDKQTNTPDTIDDKEQRSSFDTLAPDDPLSVMDNIWSTEYNETEEALARMEIKLMQKKRKIYEIQRVLQNNLDNINIVLGLLHNEIEGL